MGLWSTYKLRLRRKRYLLRARRKARQLTSVQDHTAQIKPGDTLLVCTLYNEAIRMPYFLRYYRDLGIDHFLIIDNDSDDGVMDHLEGQPDISVWHTAGSYKAARFGVDWMNALQRRYCHGHWTLVVDPDEFFIYPFCDSRPIQALTDWLDAANQRSFPAMLLDMYPKGHLTDQAYQSGQDPLEIAQWFDPGNYTISTNPQLGNLWIQGGPRARVFFEDVPKNAPALNKTPLVKWDRSYAYASSTHSLVPRGLNKVYEEWGGEKTSGILLHTKFLDTFTEKAKEEAARNQHYAGGAEYAAYAKALKDHPELWCEWSEKYINWRQLEILGLMSKGSWA